MTQYIRSFNPIWANFDLNGLIFDDTFYLYTLQNVFPYLPEPVYHTVSGTPYSNPIQYLANGTLPVDIYWNPEKVYRLEFRQNDGTAPPSQNDALIYVVENYVPSEGGDSPSGITIQTDNQITNPQFSLINFFSPLSLTGITDETISIAPGWEIVVSGTGNLTVTQQDLTAIDEVPTNAPYGLLIQTTGFNATGNYLRQRFNDNGTIWSNEAIATSVTARTGDGINHTMNLNIVNNASVPQDQDIDSYTLTTAWQEFLGAIAIDESTNNTASDSAYTELRISLPSTGTIGITSVQLVGQDTPIELPFEQETVNRQIDHTFHYYKPKIEFKPIPSMLTGWDFPLNPAQLGNSGNIGAAAGYIWDQTIAERGASAVAYQRNSITNGLQFTTPATTDSFYLMQYLTGAQATEIIQNKLACNVYAYTNGVGAITGRVYLFRGSSAATVPTLTTTIGTLFSNGDFTLTAANWTEIPRGNLGEATFAVNSRASNNNDYGLSGWEILEPTEINDTDKFAIVVTFAHNNTPTELVVNSISMVKGNIPTRPAPQTLDEVLRNCEYYYEKSTFPGVLPTSGTLIGSVMSYQPDEYDSAGISHGWYRAPFSLEFNTVKRIAPTASTLVFYDIAGNANSIRYTVYNGNTPATGGGFSANPVNLSSTDWDKTMLSTKRATMLNNVKTAVVTESSTRVPDAVGVIEFQYSIDCRLGII